MLTSQIKEVLICVEIANYLSLLDLLCFRCFLQRIIDRCDGENLMFFVQQLIEDAGEKGIIYAINNAKE
mgnify:FL=1